MMITNDEFERMEEEGVTRKPGKSSVSAVIYLLILDTSVLVLHSDMLLLC